MLIQPSVYQTTPYTTQPAQPLAQADITSSSATTAQTDTVTISPQARTMQLAETTDQPTPESGDADTQGRRAKISYRLDL